MKLKGFIWTLWALVALGIIARFFWNLSDNAFGFFSVALTLFAVGLDLVRRELEELRQTIAAKDTAAIISEVVQTLP
jgi:hypothetical protein